MWYDIFILSIRLRFRSNNYLNILYRKPNTYARWFLYYKNVFVFRIFLQRKDISRIRLFDFVRIFEDENTLIKKIKCTIMPEGVHIYFFLWGRCKGKINRKMTLFLHASYIRMFYIDLFLRFLVI